MTKENKIVRIPKNKSQFAEVFEEILNNEKNINHLAVVWLDKDGIVNDFWTAETSSFVTLGMVDWVKTRIKDYIKENGE